MTLLKNRQIHFYSTKETYLTVKYYRVIIKLATYMEQYLTPFDMDIVNVQSKWDHCLLINWFSFDDKNMKT